MHLIVTRPAADAADFARQLQVLGHRVSLAPLLYVSLSSEPVPLDGVQAIIATSRNALRAIADGPYRAAAAVLPVFVVGPGSEALARSIGFQTVTTGDGGARELLPRILGAVPPKSGPLLYLRGDRVAFDMVTELQRAGFEVRQQVVYRAIPATALPSDVVRDIRSGVDTGVILMSPRSAETFRRLASDAGLTEQMTRLTYFCLSPNVADALGSPAPRRVATAKQPTAEEMLALVKELASNPS